MKNIFELYNECDGSICSTPANTLGVGNPVLPGENGEVGSEPLCGKCKKEKAKKKKIYIEPKLKESLLGNMEDNLNIGEIELEFIEWFADEQCSEYRSITRENVISELYKCISFEGKDTVVIDLDKNDKKVYTLEEIIIRDNYPPAGIKTIKCINVGQYGNVSLLTKKPDISSINFEIYSNKANSSPSDIYISCNKLPKNCCVKIGKIICDKLLVFDSHDSINEIEIDSQSIILDLNLSHCKKLADLTVDYTNIPELTIKSDFVKQLLHKHNVIPWSTELDIRQ